MATTGRAWAGIDIGKTHHWVCVLDADGKVLLSKRLANDETEIVSLMTTHVVVSPVNCGLSG